MESSSNAAREAARARLAAAEAKREDILLYHIANGVNIESRTVEIDEGVVIAPGATILSGTILRGKTVIGAGCVIGPNSLIEDSTVDEGTTVNASQVYGSHLGPHNNIGPFTHVRVNTVTDYGVHLGAYVETKNSNFARGNTVSPRSVTTASSAATPTSWLRSRSATVPTPPQAAPSPRMCPRRPSASRVPARPTSKAGPPPRWKPTSPKRRSWRMSRASKPLHVLNAPLSLAFARQLPRWGSFCRTSPYSIRPRPLTDSPGRGRWHVSARRGQGGIAKQ